MSIVVEAPRPTRKLQAERTVESQTLLLDNITWEQYEAIGDALQDRAGLRLTYDSGRLEFMTTSPRHEVYKHWSGRLLETVAEEMSIAVWPAGNMTFRRRDLAAGLEPDECYWIAHEPEMRGKLEWDPTRDPPPDVVMEIEVSRKALGAWPFSQLCACRKFGRMTATYY